MEGEVVFGDPYTRVALDAASQGHDIGLATE
jgi:hypothetical protein